MSHLTLSVMSPFPFSVLYSELGMLPPAATSNYQRVKAVAIFVASSWLDGSALPEEHTITPNFVPVSITVKSYSMHNP